jgi:MFS family permease
MTEARTAADERDKQQEARRPNPYLELLRRPGALGFSAAGALGRMPISMIGLGTILLITAITGRYGAAGVVAAAGSVGSAICAPLMARLSDRLGQHQVLRPQAAVFALAVIGFISCAQLRAPFWAMLATGALAGASMPSLGSMVRSRWSALIGGSGQLLQTAFALESVADELIFVIGPAVVTVLATEVFPAAGVAVAALLCVTGTLLFAAQRRTQPVPRPRPPRAARRASAPSLIALVPSLIALAPVYLFAGSMFATIDLSTVAFAQEHGHKPLAGLILGTYALGSAVGGLWYGSRTWRAPLERRFAVSLGCAAAGVATFWAMPGLLWLTAVVFFSGMAIAPTLIAGLGLIERQAPAERRTEGMTWLTSTISVGMAAGAAIAGHVIDVGGARWGYGYAAGSAAAAVAVCLLGRRRLSAAATAQPAECADAQLSSGRAVAQLGRQCGGPAAAGGLAAVCRAGSG